MPRLHNYQAAKVAELTDGDLYRRKCKNPFAVEAKVLLGLGMATWVEVNTWATKGEADKECARIQRKINKRKKAQELANV